MSSSASEPEAIELRSIWKRCSEDGGSMPSSHRRCSGSKLRQRQAWLFFSVTAASALCLSKPLDAWVGTGLRPEPKHRSLILRPVGGASKPLILAPKKVPKPIVKQKISEGRRLVRIGEMIDAAAKIKEVKFAEARKGVESMRKMRDGHKWWKGKMPYSTSEDGAYGLVKQYGGEIARWLPDVLTEPGQSLWSDPLVSDDLAMLFDAFDADLETELAPVVVFGLKNAFKEPSFSQVTVILEAMAMARHTYDEAYKVVGETGAMLLAQGSEDQIAEFGFALALAVQRAPKQCFLTLKEGLQTYLANVPGISIRLLAWACTEGGSPLPELFGAPPIEVPSKLAEHVWSTCSSVASQTENRLITGWPLPIVEAAGVLSSDQMASLIQLANEKDLWRPSARRASSNGTLGPPLEGCPWTALLSSPDHRQHPSAMALRQWTADLFAAPVAFVEAVRLIRYRQGEGARAAHADARPPHDTSLWLSGQRVATVMLQLGKLPAGAGGNLLFPLLEEGAGKEVELQSGRALIWPTTDRAGKPEAKAARQALPVERQVTKYVAMTWLRTAPAPGEPGGVPS